MSGAPTPATPVLTSSLRASIDHAVAALPAGKQGHVAVNVSLTGADVSVAQRGPWGLVFGGYAKRLWGGGYEAGARMTTAW